MHIQWSKIETAPYNKEVLLAGASGYYSYERFIVNGHRERDFNGGQWVDVTGERLSDKGWHPTHWAIMANLP